MRLPSLLAAFIWLVASVWAPAGASAQSNFMEGLAAYDAGDYRTAFEEWWTLAETGDAEAQTALAGLYLDAWVPPQTRLRRCAGTGAPPSRASR